MTRELSPFFISPPVPLVLIDHQASREIVFRLWRQFANQPFALNWSRISWQIDKISKGWIVSSSWSQRGNLTGWGRPRCDKRSLVYHLCATSHMKKQHLLGVPDPLPWPKDVLSDFLRWVACRFFCFVVTFHHAHQSSVICRQASKTKPQFMPYPILKFSVVIYWK